MLTLIPQQSRATLGPYWVGQESVVRRLYNWAKGEAMLLAVAFSMKADMPSGPLALSTSSLFMRAKPSSGVTSWVGRSAQWYDSSVSGCSTVFQQLAKNVFSSDAFSVSSVTVWFSCWRAGIVSLFLLSSFSLPEISGIAHYLSKYSLFLILVRPTILFLSFLYCWKWASFNDLFAFMKRVLRLWRSWMMFFKPGKVTASFVDNDVECTLPW